ncbi:hypothetical protein PV08_02332 [Exophiala spinifera]|uniref:HypA-like protein n=1 Tax=Exophiala spinifera TaxID=91928 RepID=A0A0D2BHH6_9EURO|nr:uncharacterized protein PV08_02332 [Exophiala spinifera]KIW18045.1 hypothetical protein PV08_02332 [Exophiala spinifera]
MATAAHVELDPAQSGIYHVPSISRQSRETGSKLLQENHERFHIIFNNAGFHNHIAHHLLTIHALGATPEELRRAFDSNTGYQRKLPPTNEPIVQQMSQTDRFKDYLGKRRYFHDYEVFFRNEIEQKGWETVLNEHVFARTEHSERMLVHMFAGLLHPLIHLGFGVEFKQPAIIVEALAQAAIQDGSLGKFLYAAEESARQNQSSKSLVQLIRECRANKKLRDSPHAEDSDKLLHGVFARAPEEMIDIASQWTVKPEQLQQKTAEMINAAAYFAAGAQRPGKQVKFDFLYMHCVNCSIFFSAFLNEPWLSVENKCRLLEWKGRLDLASYVSRGSPELFAEEIMYYKPRRPRDGWAEISRRAVEFPDDGHASKLVRALANGAAVCKPYEGQSEDVFVIQGDEVWLKLGHMAIDSVEAGTPHWIFDTGFDQAWAGVPQRARL